jgi:CheY-like chemotaxis protein
VDAVGINQRRHTRVPGPFDGYWIGLLDTPVRIHDLSEGGCFVNSLDTLPSPGRPLVLKIDVPDEGWICLKAQVVYTKPELGFAVSFVDVPADAADRLRRGLLRLRGLLTDSQTDQVMMLPACPRCRGTSVRPLGMAGSSLPWFACATCDAVWAAREPVVDKEAPNTEVPALVTQHSSAKQILIADDDGGVLALLTKVLSGYRLLAARDVAEAWRLGRSTLVDLLITDYLMPDGTGEELITRLRETHPALKVLILTGHGAMLDDEGFGWWARERHLAKPCRLDDLRAAVTDLIGPP